MPTAVILSQAPQGFEKAASLDAELLENAQCVRSNGVHFRLPGDHQIWLPEAHPDQPLAVVIPLDGDLPLRIAGALRLHRLITAKIPVQSRSRKR